MIIVPCLQLVVVVLLFEILMVLVLFPVVVLLFEILMVLVLFPVFFLLLLVLSEVKVMKMSCNLL